MSVDRTEQLRAAFCWIDPIQGLISLDVCRQTQLDLKAESKVFAVGPSNHSAT
jgi:hypothetical protein